MYILQAGIEANQLTIVYEDAAISSYCKHLRKEKRLENGFLVVDLGGKKRYTLRSIFKLDSF